MYLLPLIGCFSSSVLNGLMVARAIGHRGALFVSLFGLGVAAAASGLIWVEVCLNGCPVWMDLGGVWFAAGSFQVGWTLCFDMLTAHMLLTVTSVSFAVHCYALLYMRADPHHSLFMSYLSLFTFFMLVLVTADNLVSMLVGWEGIGVCSYLLIGYWTNRLSAVKSAGKAILVNRVSDGLLMWGILYVWHYTGSLEYDLCAVPMAAGGQTMAGGSGFLALSLLIGAMGKSAQILFHVWLADAMEGPTPVSALIHAATLVTAGVYLCVRMNAVMDSLIIYVGSLTAFMAGVFGFMQADLKRVIAFSTCSQLGYMMVSVGLAQIGAEAAMCHLMTHASFKAALFLAAGVVIVAAGGHQHTARYGGLSIMHTSSFCLLTLLVGCLSLVGWPELSGFYSKEAIMNLCFVSFAPAADYAHTMLLLSALITACYTCKLFLNCFILDFSGMNPEVLPMEPAQHPEQRSLAGHLSITNLLYTGAMSLLLLDILLKVWVGTNLVSGMVLFIPWGTKTLPFGLVLAGFLCATAATALSMRGLQLLRFAGTRWGFDQMYARALVVLLLDWGRVTWAVGDRGVLSVNNLRAHI
uniref:NADH dehydrogenase subunit 5 n=1 Tax=Leontynka pallida TaxID=2912034 RepID=UPI002028E37B|nr:NADH dehydrogenase subunit 5 [Leontynka pallida]UPQ43833.1 NADH dehydrogenase subunit 5 [Leontynka pallida]